MKKVKFDLKSLEVKSFVTSFNTNESEALKGGESQFEKCMAGATEEGAPGCGGGGTPTLDGAPGCNPSIALCGSYASCNCPW